jgi:hypothetical protein
MAKFGPVAPIQVLEGLYDQGPEIFGHYHLLLAHHTVAEADRFEALFKRIDDDGLIAPTIIMDNSIVELGGSVDFDMVKRATEIIVDACSEATVIPVLPDIMGDGAGTREVVADNYDRWSREMPGNGFMAVCQGLDIDDYEESVRYLGLHARFPEITWLGIPRILVKTLGSRKGPVLLARMLSPKHSLHMLGFSDNMEDDHNCAHIKGVDGIDSAVPLRIPHPFNLHTIPEPRDPTWFDTAHVNSDMLRNLEYIRAQFEVLK